MAAPVMQTENTDLLLKFILRPMGKKHRQKLLEKGVLRIMT
jgi:hypothetical protein